MAVIFSAPPPPGSTQPGDLYVDLQSRSLWLGVDTAVDPSGAVLISDIEALLANDTATLADANAYTDVAVSTKAPISHTHPSAQITDFVPAVQSVVNAMPSANFMAGMIVLWPGRLVDIGVGDLAGWALCDGASLPRATYPELFAKLQTIYGSVDSTHFNIPDLRDRFVVGAGNINPGTKNTPANFLVSAAGAHTHVVGGTALTAAMLPAHTHTFSDTFNGTTSAAGTHSHTFPVNQSSSTRGDPIGRAMEDEQVVNRSVSTAPNHTHTFSGTISGTTSSVGSGATHTHTLTNADDHQHTVTAAQVKAALNHMAMAYIIKL